MKMHRHVLWDHTQRSHAPEFWIFAPKVRYKEFKVKPDNRHLTALMASDHHHIYIVGRYRQGQHILVTLRSQGQSQGHQGHYRFLADFTRFSLSPPTVLIVGQWKCINMFFGTIRRDLMRRNFEFLPPRSDIGRSRSNLEIGICLH